MMKDDHIKEPMFRILHSPSSRRDGTQTAYILILLDASSSKHRFHILSLFLFDVHFSLYCSVHHIPLICI